jgi:Holliday junction DNA helicase RuvA
VIAQLRGVPVSWSADTVVLDVGGVGYRLHATPSAIRKAEKAGELTLQTYMHVREDALQLYGFAETGEGELFELLLGVSGVGPKVALAIVSGYSPNELRRAIVREDVALFESIPGIGRKTAQRVCLELQEKMAPLAVVPSEGAEHGDGDGHLVARDALVELGYSVGEAEKRLAETDPELPAAERVRQALRAA